MLFEPGAVQDVERLQKEGGIGIEDTSIKEGVLLPVSGVCGCIIDVQQYNVVLGAREHRFVEVSGAQGTSCAG